MPLDDLTYRKTRAIPIFSTIGTSEEQDKALRRKSNLLILLVIVRWASKTAEVSRERIRLQPDPHWPCACHHD
jgi:hypothetical protein